MSEEPWVAPTCEGGDDSAASSPPEGEHRLAAGLAHDPISTAVAAFVALGVKLAVIGLLVLGAALLLLRALLG
jgi:hypothetical protein